MNITPQSAKELSPPINFDSEEFETFRQSLDPDKMGFSGMVEGGK